MSQKDSECLATIRQNLAELLSKVPSYNTDFNLIRWLQGYDYRLDIVIPLLRNHLRCHLAWNLDEILNEKPNEICESFYPGGLCCSPVRNGSNSYLIIETLGKLDVEGLFASVSFLEVLRNRVASAERTQRHFVKMESITGQQASVIFLLDLSGLQLNLKSFYSLAAGPYTSLCAFFNQHYVEHVKHILVINVPTIFTYLWAAMKPLLAQKTREKVRIMDGNWRQELLSFIDEDMLPVYWGGRMVDTDGDPQCGSIFTVPQGKIPPEFYWKPTVEDETMLKKMKDLRVAAGSTEFLTFQVKQENVQLNWYFICSGTFSFGIFFSEKGDETNTNVMDMFFPYLIDLSGPQKIPEKGRITCSKIGFYKVLFANTSAWFHSIRVSHHFFLTDVGKILRNEEQNIR